MRGPWEVEGEAKKIQVSIYSTNQNRENLMNHRYGSQSGDQNIRHVHLCLRHLGFKKYWV